MFMLTEIEKDWLNERFQRMGDRLDVILEQVKKTNGRVNDLEEREKNHVLRCPQGSRLEKIEKYIDKNKEDLAEYHFVQKHPKFFFLSTVVLSIAAIIIFLTKIGLIIF